MLEMVEISRQFSLRFEFPWLSGTNGGVAGPLIYRFFQQNECVSIHKCEWPFWHMSFYWQRA